MLKTLLVNELQSCRQTRLKRFVHKVNLAQHGTTATESKFVATALLVKVKGAPKHTLVISVIRPLRGPHGLACPLLTGTRAI